MPESKPTNAPEPTEDPWRAAFVEFEKRDAKMVKDYQEEIDTLLVFVRRRHHLFILGLTTLTSQAGLFSAVLTAFVVESYQSLQEDYTQTSVDLLRHISYQLANSSFPAAPDSSQFHAQRSDVQVNMCWFVSLLLSLVVALFGIFLKQWMRTYMKWTDVTPDRDAVALRQFRYRGLKTWHLGAILTLLPTLLQLSVILFLSGLLVFLWNLDRMVADTMIVLSSIVFFVIAIVTILPSVSRSCLYRSPLSEILAIPFWRVADCVEITYKASRVFFQSKPWTTQAGLTWLNPRWHSRHWTAYAEEWLSLVRSKAVFAKSWSEADQGTIFRYNRSKDHVSTYVYAMVHMCRTTRSQPLLSAAITAILKEDFSDIRSSSFTDEVWWPLVGRIFLIGTREKVHLSSISPSRSFSDIFSAFELLSPSMKIRWLAFLLRCKSFMVKSNSGWAIESYLLCCIASSAADGQCMVALMEVLQAWFLRMNDRQRRRVVCWLFESHGPQAQAVLWDSKSGSSMFTETIATRF
jgi:hypothetical protein